MMRTVLTFTLIGGLVLSTGCQATNSLFGKKDLPKDLQIAEARIVEANAQPSQQSVADLIDGADRELAAQRYSAAKAGYEKVLQKDQSNAHAHHRLAVIADVQKRFEDAERHYQAAVNVDGRNSQLLSDFGYSYILQSRLDDAEIRLNQARAADPSNLNAAANLALLYAHRGDREKCLAIARLLGPPESAEQTVDSLFAQAGRTAAPAASSEEDRNIRLAGAFDFMKRDKAKDDVQPGEVNDLTRDLANRMQAAREASIRDRQMRNGIDPRRQVPSTQEALDARGMSPGQLVDALAEIDRLAPQADNRPHLAADPRIGNVHGGAMAQAPIAQTPPAQSPQTSWPSQASSQPSPSAAAWPQAGGQQTAAAGQQVPGQTAYQNATPFAGQEGGLVTADHTEQGSPQFGSASRSQNIVGTNGIQEPLAAQWPTAPATNGMTAGLDSSQSGYQAQPFPNAPPSAFGNTAPSDVVMSPPANNADLEAARQQAAALGMGAGLGGMFDRYAYKPNEQAMSPQSQPTYGQQPTLQQQQGVPGGYGSEPAAGPQGYYAPGQQQITTTPQQWPGTDSRFGAQYPAVQRQLPTDRVATPPAISAGMPVAPNWQGQTMPASSPQLSGPAQYGTVSPTGAFAPAPPSTAFSAPVMNTHSLPAVDPTRDTLNNNFNALQRRMMGTPNMVPQSGYAQQSPAGSATQTGPTNSNVPYFDRGTAPAAGGFQNTQPAGIPANVTLPPGFVQPPPYNGGAATQPTQQPSNGRVSPSTAIPPAYGADSNGLPHIMPGQGM